MSFLGKEYVLEKQENYNEFMETLGETVSEKKRKEVMDFKARNKVTKNGDEYTLSVTVVEGFTHEITFKSGVPFDEKIREHTSKSVITVEGDTLTHIQKFGDIVTFTHKRVYSGDTMVLTTTSSNWNGEAKRYFKAV
ncbi:fatty acid-binding protein 2-like [Pectinophora gossypiella]|uniref:fatty acid-binding protein 2-like n=1 Tax=Pectinophora gossypiella TaxID=13191 RepID=UPI00214E5CC9|nr:fatty acid-binding protein 2-like [Pectinophora gossypiella]